MNRRQADMARGKNMLTKEEQKYVESKGWKLITNDTFWLTWETF